MRWKIEQLAPALADAAAVLLAGEEHTRHRAALQRVADDGNFELVFSEVWRIAGSLSRDTLSGVSADPPATPSYSVEPSSTGIVLDEAKLKLLIRQQMKAEKKISLADDIFVAAYRQCGSIRTAAEYLTQETGKKVSKDKVKRALDRFGGVQAVLRSADSDSIQRTVPSQERDRQERYASPTRPPEDK